jgi:FlaA1/EpsC-like NDP-sugar epimerase
MIATLIWLSANFLTSRADQLPRSTVLLFVVLVNAGIAGTRTLKSWLLSAPATEPASGAAISAPSLRAEGGPVLVVGGAGYIGSLLCRKYWQPDGRYGSWTAWCTAIPPSAN